MKSSNIINLDESDRVIFDTIISSLPYKVYAYGSRVKNTNQKFSDLDLCIAEEISDSDLDDIREQFKESDIGIKVDIQRLSDMSKNFFNLIKDDLVVYKRNRKAN